MEGRGLPVLTRHRQFPLQPSLNKSVRKHFAVPVRTRLASICLQSIVWNQGRSEGWSCSGAHRSWDGRHGSAVLAIPAHIYRGFLPSVAVYCSGSEVIGLGLLQLSVQLSPKCILQRSNGWEKFGDKEDQLRGSNRAEFVFTVRKRQRLFPLGSQRRMTNQFTSQITLIKKGTGRVCVLRSAFLFEVESLDICELGTEAAF